MFSRNITAYDLPPCPNMLNSRIFGTMNPFPDLVLMRPVFFHTSTFLCFKLRRITLRQESGVFGV